MSIRLRLTLLYSAILALSLMVFSTSLYVTQAQSSLQTTQANLMRQADGFLNVMRHPPDRPGELGLPSGSLPGRWTQVRNISGTVTARTGDLADSPLPLSEAGLRAVQAGGDWYETAQVSGEPVLIFSRLMTTSANITQIEQVGAPIGEREQSLSNLRLMLVTGSGLAILAAFGIGWVLAGASLGPIDRITRTAQAIGAERNFSRRVQHSGPNDEVGQLATTVNTMLNELESAFRQTESLLESQRRFVADASHELRTPLTTVRGNIELLNRQPQIEARERVEILKDTQDEVDRLIRLVNQLLVLARVDSGRVLRREPLPLKPLLEDVARQAKLLAPDRATVYDAGDARVIGDPDALKQVLLILLDNARVHTPSKATIRVTNELVDGQVAISVRDNGGGIPPDVLPHIFERFYRGDASRSGEGTGLGLAIAKELVDAQGGALTVQTAPGKGSVFTVRLPQAA